MWNPLKGKHPCKYNVNGICVLGKPNCTHLGICEYKPYADKFFEQGKSLFDVIRFFRMYRKWLAKFWIDNLL